MTHSRMWALALVLAIACGAPLPVHAQQAGAASRAEDEEAIRQANAAYRQAVEKGDLEAVVKFWAPDADYVDHLGHAYKIHAALTAAQQLAHEEGRIAGPPLKTETLAIRFISSDVAVEDGLVERTTAGGDHPPFGRYCAVWVKRDGKWLIDGVRESLYRGSTAEDHFQDLEWMVGEWEAEGPQATAEVSCQWGPNRAYLLRNVKVTPEGGEPITATQWIGWDPTHERLRSFVYDSQGGFGEGTWSKDGDAWVVSSQGTLPNGKRTKATNLYSRVDDNTAIWESVDEEVDGRPGFDFRLRATRKPPKK